MELLEKKRKAAVIAATAYLQMQKNKEQKSLCCNWSKMGMARTMKERELIYRQGRTIGIRIF